MKEALVPRLPTSERADLQERLATAIENENYDHIILIDYPGFNLRLAKKIKKNHNIPIIYYISPQLWAWKESRIKYVRNYIDKMLVIFPFEKEWYHKRGINVEWVGHPSLDNIKEICKNNAKNNN